MEVTERMREFMNDLIGERMEQVYQEKMEYSMIHSMRN